MILTHYMGVKFYRRSKHKPIFAFICIISKFEELYANLKQCTFTSLFYNLSDDQLSIGFTFYFGYTFYLEAKKIISIKIRLSKNYKVSSMIFRYFPKTIISYFNLQKNGFRPTTFGSYRLHHRKTDRIVKFALHYFFEAWIRV